MAKFVIGDLVRFNPSGHNEFILSWYFVPSENDYSAHLFGVGTMGIYLKEEIINASKFHEILIEKNKYYISNQDLILYVDKYPY